MNNPPHWVSLKVRATTSRAPFTYIATLEDECLILVTTRDHATWAAAAAAALRIADAMGYVVFDRPLIARRVAKEGGVE